MVELSLRDNKDDPCKDFPPSFQAKTECHSSEAKLQPMSTRVTIGDEGAAGNRAAQLAYSALVQAARELVRITVCRMNRERAKIYTWLRTRIGIAALALVAFTLCAVGGHDPDFVKRQMPVPVKQAEKPLLPYASVAPQNVHNGVHAIAPSKAKPRRRNDYVAKDTYVYYGKGGKPSH
jgi:hypothetical protein